SANHGLHSDKSHRRGHRYRCIGHSGLRYRRRHQAGARRCIQLGVLLHPNGGADTCTRHENAGQRHQRDQPEGDSGRCASELAEWNGARRPEECAEGAHQAAAGFVAVLLAEVAAFSLHASTFHNTTSLNLAAQALVAGLLATPLAPIAKDLASSLTTAAKAVQSVKS